VVKNEKRGRKGEKRPRGGGGVGRGGKKKKRSGLCRTGNAAILNVREKQEKRIAKAECRRGAKGNCRSRGKMVLKETRKDARQRCYQTKTFTYSGSYLSVLLEERWNLRGGGLRFSQTVVLCPTNYSGPSRAGGGSAQSRISAGKEADFPSV